RRNGTAHEVTMADGRIFTVGGSWSGGIGGKNSEIYENGQWKLLPGLPVDFIMEGTSNRVFIDDNHAWLWPAPNGKIFHAGPSQYMHWIDPSGNGSYTQAGLRGDDGFAFAGISVMYDEGKLLVAGGAPGHERGEIATNNSYTIDINTDNAQLKKQPPMQYSRTKTDAVVLPNGEVMVIGGLERGLIFTDVDARMIPEVWNPQTEQWRPMAAMQTPRTYHSVALLLADGRVFVGGGGLCGACGTANHPDVEIFSPPYLFDGNGQLASRPVLNTVPNKTVFNSQIEVNTDRAIASFVLIKASSVTHSTNNEQRRIPLTFTSLGGNNYRLNIPNSNIVPPGNYMLFANDAAGVPSVSKMINISDESTSNVEFIDDRDPRNVYTGDWTEYPGGIYFQNTCNVPTSNNASVELNFEGNYIAWHGIKNADLGFAEIFIDGISQGKVDSYGPTAVASKLFEKDGLSAGNHTIRIVRTGEKNAASSNFYLVHDYFEIRSTDTPPPPPSGDELIDDRDARNTYSGNWTNHNDPRYHQTTCRVPRSNNAFVELNFTGTYIAWHGLKNVDLGVAEIFIDGVSQGKVDSYGPVFETAVLFEKDGLSEGNHNIRIVRAEEKNPASTNYYLVHDYFEVKQTDTPPPPPPVDDELIDDRDSRNVYTGNWTNHGGSVYHENTCRVIRTNGGAVELNFSGNYIAWHGLKNADLGVAEIFIDGVSQGKVDTYDARRFAAKLFEKDGLASGNHSIRIVRVGEKNAASSNFFLVHDYFEVKSSSTPPPPPTVDEKIDDRDARNVYSGSWNEYPGSLYYQNTCRVPTSNNAYVELTFNGTYIAWHGLKNADLGLAEIFIDGLSQGKIDCYDPRRFAAKLFEKSGLSAGSHTIRIVRAEEKNAASSNFFLVHDYFELKGNNSLAANTDFISFTAEPSGRLSLLSWEINASESIREFRIEHSIDA
ncbi:MAG: galactose oxidase-like domain-containing protein, partial [Bacteroidota bacterium]